jgi:hypothetical protein
VGAASNTEWTALSATNARSQSTSNLTARTYNHQNRRELTEKIGDAKDVSKKKKRAKRGGNKHSNQKYP